MFSPGHSLLCGVLSAILLCGAEAQTNVALNKPTDGDVAFGFPTSNGNDGNTATFTHADNASPAPANPYWRVDLQGVFDIDRIEITDRIGCCDPNRLNGSQIRFYDSEQSPVGQPVTISGLPPNSSAAAATLTFDNNGAGWQGVAFVRIDGYTQYFQFSEFKAFAATPVNPNENIAAGKPVTATGATWGGFPAANVADGNPATFTHPLTSTGTQGFYFQVDLQGTFTLDRILLRNRSDGCCPERLSNFRVSVFADGGTGAPGALTWSADMRTDGTNSGTAGIDTLQFDDGTGTFGGRFVRVENRNTGGYSPQIAEIEVYAAPLPRIDSFNTSAGNITATGDPNLPTSAILSWSVANYDTLQITPGIGVVTGPSGSVSVMPAQTRTYSLIATNSAGSSTASVTIGVDQAELPPVLNEFLAANVRGIEDADGSNEDWIEIRNPNGFSLNLDGFHLTDDPADLTKWRIPAVSAPANGYVVIFASNKNRTSPAAELHTNFRLSNGGEYLALIGRNGSTVLGQFPQDYPATAAFPRQGDDISYGLVAGGGAAFLNPPTPGGANGIGYAGFVEDTKFSVDRGYYTAPVSVAITSLTPGASIRYTTNGSAPAETSGTLYTGPVSISSTTVLRAIAYKAGFTSSDVDTHTYIFPANVAASPVMRTAITGDATYGPQMVNALTDLPAMVITTPAVINGNTEVKAALEFILPGGTPGFREDCGVKHFGGAFTDFPKKNFRFYFRGEYGVTKLEYPLFENYERGGVEAVQSFDQLELRAGSHDMKQRGFSLSNSFTDDTMLDTGNVNPHGRYVHLYINGTYWGLYQLRERWHAAMLARHLGGPKETYESINGNWNVGGWADPGTAYDGDGSAWTRIKSLRGSYTTVRPYLDVRSYADFMLMFMFGDSEDEYRCTGPADAGSGFKWFLNDADGFTRAAGNRTGRVTPGRSSGDGPGSIFSMLVAEGHPDFKTLLADRIHFLFFNDGPMTPARNIARLQQRVAEVTRPMIPEIARWGGSGGNDNFPSPANWESTKNAYVNSVLPGQTANVIGYYRSAGFYPATAAPVFSQHGGGVASGQVLGISAPAGTIYYTLDGTDPRLPGGAISPAAIEYDDGANAETIVAPGAAWKFFDTGPVPNTPPDLGSSDIVVGHPSYSPSNWKHPSFNDATWASGNAQLGYGENDEATVVSYGTDSLNKHRTCYFRRAFTVANTSDILSATLRVKRDDGAIVYVNGFDAGRTSMLPGNATGITFAQSAADDGASFHDITFSPAMLVTGLNVIAVEVHQATAGSSDLSFDLELQVTRTTGGNGSNLTLTKNSAIRARAKNGAEWSAINEAFFTVGGAPPVAPGDIAVSELHYHPSSEAEGEFLEIRNVSDHAVNLRGVTFTSGIEYTFSDTFDTMLAAGQRLVLVASLYSFQQTWGLDLPVAGIYRGNLDNDGETIAMSDKNGVELLSFTYNDNALWPQLSDGGGHSLVYRGGDPDNPLSWRDSLAPAANPFVGDGTTFTGDPAELFDFALADAPRFAVSADGVVRIEVLRRAGSDGVTLRIEESTDIASWADSGFLLESRESIGTTELLIFVSPQPIPPTQRRVFLRVRLGLVD